MESSSPNLYFAVVRNQEVANGVPAPAKNVSACKEKGCRHLENLVVAKLAEPVAY